MVIYVLFAGILILLAGLILIYNRLVRQWQMVNNGWADIDVQLKRRSDLVPRLVDVVSAYAAHERTLFEDIAEKRTQARIAGEDPTRRAEAENALAGPVTQLLLLAEAYPDLKASENFSDLQNDLVQTENQIEMARRFYNGAVRELNTTVESFPANLVAPLLGFSPRTYFETDSVSRQVPQVRLTGS
jgi:LemA protein